MPRALAASAPLVLLAVAGSAGCSADAGTRSVTVLRRDSAGVAIVETPSEAWADEERWSVYPEPSLVIGLEEGDAAYLWGEIVGVTRLRDGSFAVADRQAAEIRFFDATGRFLRTAGRQGGGPGEFHYLHALWACGEGRLYTWDRRRNRVAQWDTDGRLEREFDLLEPYSDRGWGPYRALCSPRGDFLAVGWGETPTMMGRVTQSQLLEHTSPVWLLDSLAQPVAELGTFLIADRVLIVSPRGGGTTGPHPLGRVTQFAIDSQHVYVATSERLEILVYRRDGSLARILRGPPQDLRIDDALLDRYLAGGAPSSDSMILARIRQAELPLPAGLPAIAGIELDPGGNIWVKRFQLPWEHAERWGVFAADGVFLGHVDMPLRFTVHEIGDDYVLGVARDEVGVERVQVHTLRRTAP